MSETTNSASGGIGFFGLLGIVFIALKLTGIIHWNWLWVLAPIWAPIALVLVAILIVGLAALIFDR